MGQEVALGHHSEPQASDEDAASLIDLPVLAQLHAEGRLPSPLSAASVPSEQRALRKVVLRSAKGFKGITEG